MQKMLGRGVGGDEKRLWVVNKIIVKFKPEKGATWPLEGPGLADFQVVRGPGAPVVASPDVTLSTGIRVTTHDSMADVIRLLFV